MIGPRRLQRIDDERCHNTLSYKELQDLIAFVTSSGIAVGPESAEQLDRFCREVAHAARRSNLVSIADIPHLVEKHVAASLGVLLASIPDADERWIDVGTGAGFPGMVVKICFPECRMTLLDSSRRKIAFLEFVRDQLGIQSLGVRHDRIESLPRGRENEFDVILARAVAPLGRTLQLIDTVAPRGARLITFKGVSWKREVDRTAETMSALGWELHTAIRVPWGAATVLRLDRRALRPN